MADMSFKLRKTVSMDVTPDDIAHAVQAGDMTISEILLTIRTLVGSEAFVEIMKEDLHALDYHNALPDIEVALTTIKAEHDEA